MIPATSAWRRALVLRESLGSPWPRLRASGRSGPRRRLEARCAEPRRPRQAATRRGEICKLPRDRRLESRIADSQNCGGRDAGDQRRVRFSAGARTRTPIRSPSEIRGIVDRPDLGSGTSIASPRSSMNPVAPSSV